MANGFTPAIRSGDPARLKSELATVLLALRRLRADIASGRVARDGQFLSVAEIDELLETLCPVPQRAKAAEQKASHLHRSKEASAASWNALAQAVG